MLPPLPPLPFPRPQSLGDRILDLQSSLARVDAEIAKFNAWIETARGHLAAGRQTPEEFEFHSAVLRRQIATEELIRPGIVAQLAEARAAFAAQVAEGALFDRWAAQRHAEALAGQPAPEPEPKWRFEGHGASWTEPAPEPEAQPVAEEGGADE